LSKGKEVSATHDTLFRGSMENVDIARDFFVAHLGEGVLKRVRLNTLKLESSTFIDEAHKELRSDILYSATVDDRIGYLYLVVEHQSTPDKLMAFRLLSYVCRVWQRHLDQRKDTPDQLPAVLPLVMYNGTASPYPYSTHFLDCFASPELIREFLFEQFRLIDLTVMPDEEMPSHKKAAFMEWLEKHIRERDILGALEKLDADIVGEIKDLNNGSYFRFAIKYLLDKSEAVDIDKAVKLLKNKVPDREDDIMTIAQAFEQRGIEKGMKKNALEVARNLLKMGLRDEDVAKATKLPVSEIVSLH